MATEEHEVQAATGRRRRRRAPDTRPEDDGANPGLLRLLWGDLRKQQLPRELEPEELALMEAEEEMRQQFEQEANHARSISPEHMDALRRRYTAGTG